MHLFSSQWITPSEGDKKWAEKVVGNGCAIGCAIVIPLALAFIGLCTFLVLTDESICDKMAKVNYDHRIHDIEYDLSELLILEDYANVRTSQNELRSFCENGGFGD